ncbi:SusC/RagA family TonB-linked outer membrane protein [Chitinophaga cymbidii]|uniref:SusC/RagA family TonB-linked outer membrane protein n=1 Tax=Chitinophaga cymbidii TaxID=1096750 RepID=A0A512RRY6_9BACT|nr:TonB-dependent receptor [Chitinophaga cymbidii]GEP98460.1 SusC/RagA family TonB-linked outer membrane protein [Chitinophaga cymbidii]
MQFSTGFRFTDLFFGKIRGGYISSAARFITPYASVMLLFFYIAPAAAMAAGHTPPADARSFVVSGLVTNEKDEALPGASVRIKGTSKGVTTDANGKFMIEVQREEDSLVFSFLSYYSTTIKVGGQRNITVRLMPDEESQKLNEIQIVGYGTQKKIANVGAVSSVSAREIQKYSTPSLTNAIGGKLAGIITRQTSGEPGYDAAKVFIRGLVSQSGTNKPLIIVDGVERELQDYWTTMNIQEIESFTVLKDAASTAVYGNRGANGVIMITTRRGVVGKPNITFRTEAAMVVPMRIEDNIDGYEYALLHNEALENVGEAPKFSAEEIQKYKDGSDPYMYPNVNWYDVVLKKRTRQMMNNLGVSGGTETVKYYLNLGYTIQEGIYNEDPANTYKTNAALKRYNFRSNVDVKLSKRFSLALGLSGIISNTNFPGTDAGRILMGLKLTAPNTYPVKNPNGSQPGAFGDLLLNPYALTTQTGYTKQFYNTLVSNLSAKWDLSYVTPGLSARGLVAFDVVDITQNIRRKTPATYSYSKDPVTGAETYKQWATESPLGFYNLNETYRTMYAQAGIDYDRSFGNHHVTGMLTGERREFTNVNAGNSIANLPERRQGLISRLTYNYDYRYLLQLSAGYNGSENFPKGKRYGLFPAIGAGWIISNEAFWNKNTFSLLKLRGNYGIVGNDRIGGARFLYLSTYNKSATGYVFGRDQNVNPGGKSEARIGNPDVTWETAYKTDLGFDLEMFNGKFTLSSTVFHERREGQLLERRTIPIYAGYPGGTVPFGNVGVTENKGIEANIQVRNTTKSGFYYSFTVNFTYAKNKIIENDAPPALYPYQDLRGYPIGSNLGYKALGFFQDQEDIDKSPSQTALQAIIRPGDIKYEDINQDGKITSADRTVIGTYGSEPQIMYGFGATAAWKGFDATIFFTGAANRDFFFTQGWTAWAFSAQAGYYNVMQQVYDKRFIVGGNNEHAEFPAVRAASKNNYTGSTLWQRSGDYLRIKNAEIGYTIPVNLTKKATLKSIRVFIQGTNLATWDKIKVIDPESDFGTGGYPIPRNYNFGLEANF